MSIVKNDPISDMTRPARILSINNYRRKYVSFRKN